MDERLRPLKSIRTDEQYEDYKKHLTRYIDEYRLFQEKDDLRELMQKRALEYEEGSEARAALEQRGRLIDEGRYSEALERNIAAYILTIDEYEAKKENRSLFDIIKGIISKDADTKDYLKRRYMKSRAEDNGLLEPVDLSLQDPYDSVREIFKEHDFINIEPPETALVPVDTEINEIFTEVKGILKEFLVENGIGVDVENKKVENIKAEKTEATANLNRGATLPKNKEKSHDEIGDEI